MRGGYLPCAPVLGTQVSTLQPALEGGHHFRSSYVCQGRCVCDAAYGNSCSCGIEQQHALQHWQRDSVDLGQQGMQLASFNGLG